LPAWRIGIVWGDVNVRGDGISGAIMSSEQFNLRIALERARLLLVQTSNQRRGSLAGPSAAIRVNVHGPADKITISTTEANGVLVATLELCARSMCVSLDDDALQPLLKSAAQLLRDISALTPSHVAQVLIVHLPSLHDPRPFLDVLPTLLMGSPPSIVEDAVKQLKVVLEDDQSLLLPVISALVNMPLSEACIADLMMLTEHALSVADESDFPFLFRTILKSSHLNADKASHTLLVIRQQVFRRWP
jgi:hypothetical protein